MCAKDKIKRYISEHKLVNYEKVISEKESVFSLPYTFSEMGYKLNFILRVHNDHEHEFEMGFFGRMKDDENINTKLLDMNGRLARGSFAVLNDSKEVSFFAKFEMDEDELTNEEYTYSLAFCLQVFIDLVENNIVDRGTYEV